MASENAQPAQPVAAEPASENTKRPRRGRAPVPIDARYAAVLDEYLAALEAAPLAAQTLLRRLSTESRRNNVYKAFRELGRAICTITLLRLISEPELRAEIDAATNKVESYNQFSDWLAFGAEQLERNDPEQLEKLTKTGTLLANCVILHIALDMTDVVRDLQAHGHPVIPDDLATMSPYITERVKRFGEYPLDELDTPPEAFDPHLQLAANRGAGVDPIDTEAA